MTKMIAVLAIAVVALAAGCAGGEPEPEPRPVYTPSPEARARADRLRAEREKNALIHACYEIEQLADDIVRWHSLLEFYPPELKRASEPVAALWRENLMGTEIAEHCERTWALQDAQELQGTLTRLSAAMDEAREPARRKMEEERDASRRRFFGQD